MHAFVYLSTVCLPVDLEARSWVHYVSVSFTSLCLCVCMSLCLFLSAFLLLSVYLVCSLLSFVPEVCCEVCCSVSCCVAECVAVTCSDLQRAVVIAIIRVAVYLVNLSTICFHPLFCVSASLPVKK